MIVIDHDMDALFELADASRSCRKAACWWRGPPRKSRPTAWCRKPILAGPCCNEPSRGLRHQRLLWRTPTFCSMSPCASSGRGRRLARSQRRRQITTLESLMGMVTPRSGKWCSTAPSAPAGRDIARRGCNWCRKIAASSAASTSRRTSPCRATAKDKWPLERIYEMFPRLKERRASSGTDLSGGEQQMLAIARALVRDPKIVCSTSRSRGSRR